MHDRHSPALYWGLVGIGSALLVSLTLVAWTSDTAEVELVWRSKLMLTAAAFVLGGGLLSYARKYKRDSEAEARMAEVVRRNLTR